MRYQENYSLQGQCMLHKLEDLSTKGTTNVQGQIVIFERGYIHMQCRS